MTIHDLRDLKPQQQYMIDTQGNQLVAYGWACGIQKNDTLVFAGPPTAPENEQRYLVKDISYFGSPKDMWRACIVPILTVELGS